MRTQFLVILLTFLITQSYSQDFGEIKLDSKLQVKYSDTLRNIGERLSGKWKYLGKRAKESLIDTIGVSFTDDKKTIITVENGIVFEIENGKRKKANYFYEITYNFKNGKGFYSSEEKYFNKEITSISSCQPIPELVYYKGNFGILFYEMVGESFRKIRELTPERLIFENGKEYQKMK